jgi:ATP/maltotriose-dependent transcriptional regulator MalT
MELNRGGDENGLWVFPLEALTSRENEILNLLADHHTNREIAELLTLSLNTVKWYARQIYSKLGVANRRQAVHRANELGFSGPRRRGIIFLQPLHPLSDDKKTKRRSRS